MTEDPGTELPTFCHISDFGEYGYRRLHRMVAISQPLTLWSPSSVLLRSKACGISPHDFLDLVERGVIQIAGRRKWLLEQSFRDEHYWGEEARWDPEIDGKIKDIFYQDEFAGDERRRRVVVAPEAEGQTEANDLLNQHPEQLDFWVSVLTGDRPQERIPAGTFKSIQKMPWDPRQAVVYLLGSAFNHGQALGHARSEVDFLLRRADAEFMKIMAEARLKGQPDLSPPARMDDPQSEQIHILACQLLEVMTRLDDARGRGGLMRFVRGRGHSELVAWFKTISDLVKMADPVDLENRLLAELRLEVRKGRHRGLRDLFDGSPSMTLTGAGTAGMALEGMQVVQEQSLGNIIGVSISAFATGFGLCQRLGLVGGGSPESSGHICTPTARAPRAGGEPKC